MPQDERLARLAGDGTSGGGFPLSDVLRKIFQHILDNGSTETGDLERIIRTALYVRRARVEEIYKNEPPDPWTAIQQDILSLLSDEGFISRNGSQWTQGYALQPGRVLTVANGRVAAKLVIYTKQERDARDIIAIINDSIERAKRTYPEHQFNSRLEILSKDIADWALSEKKESDAIHADDDDEFARPPSPLVNHYVKRQQSTKRKRLPAGTWHTTTESYIGKRVNKELTCTYCKDPDCSLYAPEAIAWYWAKENNESKRGASPITQYFDKYLIPKGWEKVPENAIHIHKSYRMP